MRPCQAALAARPRRRAHAHYLVVMCVHLLEAEVGIQVAQRLQLWHRHPFVLGQTAGEETPTRRALTLLPFNHSTSRLTNRSKPHRNSMLRFARCSSVHALTYFALSTASSARGFDTTWPWYSYGIDRSRLVRCAITTGRQGVQHQCPAWSRATGNFHHTGLQPPSRPRR